MTTINKYGEIVTQEEETVGGYTKADICTFVYNNSEYYYKVFKKNENKRFFLHMNWAALLLSVYWMFYRKMYVEGILFMLASTLLSLCVLAASLYTLQAEITRIQAQYDTQAAVSEPAESAANGVPSYVLSPQEQLEKQIKEAQNQSIFRAVLIIAAFYLLCGLTADWLYRNYVFRKIRFSDGGVSRLAILGAWGLVLLSNAIMEMVKNGLLNTLLTK